ncbi:Valine--tRNA ligase [Dissostichus eleginoides]|uniref:Valine--tRNA ligase n=1 Tax=Dissostichus eleginoides TaxID=100907 RepID=A0AAD9FIH9_DISEL|nr:Valine--tRNA ligase [Dissostichus eleginoides]
MAEIAGSTSREETLKESGPPAILGQGPNVWIIGSSYVRRGEERARHTMGSNLGLNCRVCWFGKKGRRFLHLRPPV